MTQKSTPSPDLLDVVRPIETDPLGTAELEVSLAQLDKSMVEIAAGSTLTVVEARIYSRAVLVSAMN